MTLTELRQEVWQMIGEPSDLDPATDVQYNGGPLLNFTINEAQRQIATWKDPVLKSVIRHPQLYSDLYFQTIVLTGTLPSQLAAQSDQIVLESPTVGDDDRYNGWVVQVGAETKLITDFVGASVLATVHSAWGTAPVAGATFTLYKRFMMMGVSTEPWISEHIQLPPTSTIMRTEGNLLEVLKIEDVAQQTELTYRDRIESSLGQILSPGTPTQWGRWGNRILFDVPSSEAAWYRMEYYRLPTPLSAAADKPELDAQFHYPMCLWGQWWGWKRAQDDAKAYATWRTLETVMRGTTAHADIKMDRQADTGRLRMR